MSYEYNNLYGWDMSKDLQIIGYKWVQPANVPDLNTLNEVWVKRYIREVDFEYP